MSFFQGKKAGGFVPPPLIDPNEKDRFGLPLWFSLLVSDETRKARMAATHAFVQEAVDAVMHQVGRKQARRLFSEALNEPPKGRQSDKQENEALLAAYDQEVESGTPRRNAASVAARKMAIKDDVESVASRIRKLVKARNEQQAELWARYQEVREKVRPTLLELAVNDRKTEL
jgi:hypothetical protein